MKVVVTYRRQDTFTVPDYRWREVVERSGDPEKIFRFLKTSAEGISYFSGAKVDTIEVSAGTEAEEEAEEG
jgi:hypothetical protein